MDDEVSMLLQHYLDQDVPVALATVVEGPHIGAKLLSSPAHDSAGTLGNAELDRVVLRDLAGELAAGRTGTRRYGLTGEARGDAVTIFVESFASNPQMIVFGAVDFTRALVRVAKTLGYRVTVCDARATFATERRFPEADDVVCSWPDAFLKTLGDTLVERDAICVLTHDNKFDVPAIRAALETNVGYIGAMGSRRTSEERFGRLVDSGVDADALERVMSPIGLDIGARTPEETAIAICAEIIACAANQTENSLKFTDGPIHRRIGEAPE